MNIQKIEEQLIECEGEKLDPYLCPSGKLTIGVGHNLDANGITREMSRFILKCDIQECVDDLLRVFPGQFDLFPEDIQHVLINMRFHLGHTGFRGFKKMITAFRRQDLKKAAEEMKDSVWYRKFPLRAGKLAKIVEGFIQ